MIDCLFYFILVLLCHCGVFLSEFKRPIIYSRLHTFLLSTANGYVAAVMHMRRSHQTSAGEHFNLFLYPVQCIIFHILLILHPCLLIFFSMFYPQQLSLAKHVQVAVLQFVGSFVVVLLVLLRISVCGRGPFVQV